MIINSTVIFNIFSVILLEISIFWILFCKKLKEHHYWVKVPILFAVFIYTTIALSNVFEHSGITAYFDPVEDVSEIIFIFFLLLFLNNSHSQNSLKIITEKENWLNATRESMGDGVITSDAEGLITSVNREMERLTGKERENLIGKRILDSISFFDIETKKEIDYSPVKIVLEGGDPNLYPEGILMGNNPKPIPVIPKASRITNENNETLGVVAIFHDVSEYYSLTEELNQTRKLEAIGQLAGGVAHDLNNMLGGIVGAVDMINEQRDKIAVEGYDKLINIIYNAVDNARELNSNLLAFGRKGKIISTPISVNDVIKRSTALAERTVDKLITITINIPSNDLFVVGDPSQLENVILNLVINARDAQPDGGIIDVDLTNIELNSSLANSLEKNFPPGRYIKITVSDKGEGINPDIIDKIFEPFFTTKKEGKGTGLGLAAVYGTVKNHHGTITVENTKPKGCKFTIYLPESEIGPKDEKTAVKPDKREQKNITVLVIDDENIIRTTAKMMLEHKGYSCITAESGSEGIEKVEENPHGIDVILIDMVMPQMSGPETVKRIREINPGIPIILTSGFTKEENLSVKIDGFLKKPFSLGELLKSLEILS